MSEFPTVHAGLARTIDVAGDLTVNRLGFGAMRVTGAGIWGPPADRDVAKAVLRHAVELGTNFIDTADSYGPHISEELIHEALHPYPDDLVIATNGSMSRPKARHEPAIGNLKKIISGLSRRGLQAATAEVNLAAAAFDLLKIYRTAPAAG
ncbi:MAG: oxidoreductase [Propionibacteriaceae bacterium]|nr:oxidoreductase [Propionibacteriaceae bacterium]